MLTHIHGCLEEKKATQQKSYIEKVVFTETNRWTYVEGAQLKSRGVEAEHSGVKAKCNTQGDAVGREQHTAVYHLQSAPVRLRGYLAG